MPIDTWGLVINRINGFLKRDPSFLSVPGNISFIISASFSIVITLYGYFEARDVRIERQVVRTPKITERIRIVQISDVHIGLIIRGERVKKIVDLVNRERPDIVISTGDLVDGQINSLRGISDLLSEIRPSYGKFAITGNHEFYAGLKQAMEFTERSGFRVLRGDSITVADRINIAGVDDPAGKAYGLYIDVPERDLLSRLPREKFTILLKHRPVIGKGSAGLFDLQLSGHTHKGQFFPLSIITWLYYPVHAGRMNITDNSYLYVSRGTGTWGPPIRFLSPPEITVIDLIPDYSPAPSQIERHE
ncbi:MAG: metallophosphoesterase [Thermodesulfovibrionales bacterium]